MNDEILGIIVKAIRKNAGLTQKQLADAMPNWHWTIVAKIEKGFRSLRAVELLPLADALGCQPADFLDPNTPEKIAHRAIQAKIDELKSEIELLEQL